MTNAFDKLPMFSSTYHNIIACVIFGLLFVYSVQSFFRHLQESFASFIICSWDSQEVVLCDYLEHGNTITGAYYAYTIGKVHIALKEKR